MNEICTLLPDKRASYTRGKRRISLQVEVAYTLAAGQRCPLGWRGLQEVHRALDAPAAAIEHVSVNHRGLHALVPEELLHRPDVVAVHQQVRGEGVAHMARSWLAIGGRMLHDPQS